MWNSSNPYWSELRKERKRFPNSLGGRICKLQRDLKRRGSEKRASIQTRSRPLNGWFCAKIEVILGKEEVWMNRNGASESSVNKTINYEWFQFCEKKTSVFCETGGRMTYVGREEKGVGNPLRVCELSGSVAGSFPEWVVNVIEIICTSSQILG